MIKAIPTRYKGYHFRSRLEARWAVFFDALNIEWQYEPEGFELPNGERYLPDFYLQGMGVWVDIKPVLPQTPTGLRMTWDNVYQKLETIAMDRGESAAILTGDPLEDSLFMGWRYTDAGCGQSYWHSARLVDTDNGPDFYLFGVELFFDDGMSLKVESKRPNMQDTNLAVAAFRTARFEHGQSGAT